jgi:redox-sensitive bicupin YhaK (pirin superfamily)
MTEKKIAATFPVSPRHWVGDGFPVRSLFSYQSHAALTDPFLLLDHAAPTEFPPAERPRGVGEHPHRGFETVTLVYAGEVSHRDSSGGGGTIRPGDVQWMTAAAGVVHDEFHSEDFTRRGGMLEMVQLWVNLPAKEKMRSPRYQSILAGDIPSVELPGGAGSLRVIAGEYAGTRGPAATFTAINVWDGELAPDARVRFSVPAGFTLLVVVLEGVLQLNDANDAREGQVVLFDRDGEDFTVAAPERSRLLLLSGEPLDEPVVGYGPFVMNSEAEIHRAIEDFNRGSFGRLPADEPGATTQ